MTYRRMSLASLLLLAGCATNQPHTVNLVTSFYNMSDSQFSIRAFAPATAVRELAVCKAVWLAEKKHARSLSLSNPAYSPPKALPALAEPVPSDWVELDTTAYLTAPNPDGNPVVTVAEKAPACRSAWSWYR